ncbi:hypothetical protein K8O68_06255 [Salipaludibacillus sp. CUR1]|uniref:hypothetical protein n=1 Tax=Salipaludibacillus sp. CUR1 TaxID=2820003 RepID=UPI001E44FDFB|nr:hypothetical protein [Salipaludibacillus sp. CUR1]MCE7792023.1 hypothetical protein [Salipaludibacillus sp. CUR1]
MAVLWSFLSITGFILIHILSKYINFYHHIPRKKLLSAAGGLSIAYVFLHIIPYLHYYQANLTEEAAYGFYFEDRFVYIAALAGLAVFYGLERAAKQYKKENKRKLPVKEEIFWIHLMAYSTYNGLIGYLIIGGENETMMDFFLFFLALSIHFVINDQHLRDTHKKDYDHYGRWILGFAVFSGWLLSLLINVSQYIVALLFSFMAGALILNILKEELPEERESHFGAFSAGALLYTLVLLVSL